jgi:hypothetical protein
MKDGEEIRIRSLSGPPKTWLSLHGSILTYRERFWSRESLVEIPVELVTFTEKKQFEGTRLIAALLSLFFLPAIGGAIIGLWHLFAGAPSDTVLSICMGTGAIAGFFTFLFLLVRFFIRQKTITIHVAPEDMTITFWADGKQSTELQEIIAEINRRKEMVEETMPYPMQFAVGDTIHQPWKRTVILTFLFIIPALITEIPWLLLAGLIPICMHIYSSLMGVKEPREFKQAVRHFLKREWEEARDLVDALIRRSPDYRPARLFMIELKMRLGDFDGAESSLVEIQSDLDTETLQSIQQDIVLRRRIETRKKESIQPSPSDYASSAVESEA